MSLLERVSNAQQTYSAHDAPSHNEAHPNARTNDAALERFEELRSGVDRTSLLPTWERSSRSNPLQARNEITQVCKRVCEERPGSRQRTESARSLSIAISIVCSDLVRLRSSWLTNA